VGLDKRSQTSFISSQGKFRKNRANKSKFQTESAGQIKVVI
jgi:hypothetical protein